MKKPVGVLVLVTSVFAAFMAGFFAGRNLNRSPVQIYQAQTPSHSETITTDTEPLRTTPTVININTATAKELETLPGIGPTMAQRIIDYRTQYGDFSAPEELIKVKGIGESKLMDILDLITTGG